MSAAGSRRRGTAARLALATVTGLLTLGVLATPAQAAESTPPLADEPPGGAVCAPELPAVNCQQEGAAPSAPAQAVVPAAPTASVSASVSPSPSSATPHASAAPSAAPTKKAAAASPTAAPSGATLTSGTVAQSSATSPRSAEVALLASTGGGRAGAWGAAGVGLLATGSILVLASRPRRLDV